VRRFEVIVTPEAEASIREAFLHIHEHSPLNAARWLQGLYDEIGSLERFPERCSYARDRAYFEEDLRQLIYKSHRVVIYVDKSKQAVYVLHVRHGKRRAAGEPKKTDDE
jgi:plasmid stabilization system protein ParE